MRRQCRACVALRVACRVWILNASGRCDGTGAAVTAGAGEDRDQAQRHRDPPGDRRALARPRDVRGALGPVALRSALRTVRWAGGPLRKYRQKSCPPSANPTAVVLLIIDDCSSHTMYVYVFSGWHDDVHACASRPPVVVVFLLICGCGRCGSGATTSSMPSSTTRSRTMTSAWPAATPGATTDSGSVPRVHAVCVCVCVCVRPYGCGCACVRVFILGQRLRNAMQRSRVAMPLNEACVVSDMQVGGWSDLDLLGYRLQQLRRLCGRWSLRLLPDGEAAPHLRCAGARCATPCVVCMYVHTVHTADLTAMPPCGACSCQFN
jgi:hypothetical protein